MNNQEFRLAWIIVVSLVSGFRQWLASHKIAKVLFQTIQVLLILIWLVGTGMEIQDIFHKLLMTWMTNLLKSIASNIFG